MLRATQLTLKEAFRKKALFALHVDVQTMNNISPSVNEAFKNVNRLQSTLQEYLIPNIWGLWPANDNNPDQRPLKQRIEQLQLHPKDCIDTIVCPNPKDLAYFKYHKSLLENRAFKEDFEGTEEPVFLVDGVFAEDEKCVYTTALGLVDTFAAQVIVVTDATDLNPANENNFLQKLRNGALYSESRGNFHTARTADIQNMLPGFIAA